MENIELDYSEDLSCPFCEKVLLKYPAEEQFETCEHTIFVATDEGFEYVREDMKEEIIKKKGIGLDEYTLGLPIEGIRISQYAPSPSLFGAYWGFVA
jgi:hypothetical protein